MYRGKLITFEGGEGSGKDTQVSILLSNLRSSGADVVDVREPGSTNLAEHLRIIIKDREFRTENFGSSYASLNSDASMYLFMAARADLITRVVKPALEENKLVVSNRSWHSTFAYQGFGEKNDLRKVLTSARASSLGTMPDLTLFLDVNPEIGLKKAEKRAGEEKDTYQTKAIEFHQRVREGFLFMSLSDPERIKIIPYIEGGIEETREVIKHFVDDVLSKEKKPRIYFSRKLVGSDGDLGYNSLALGVEEELEKNLDMANKFINKHGESLENAKKEKININLRDLFLVAQSDGLITLLHESPSYGVGMEVQFARSSGIPVTCLYTPEIRIDDPMMFSPMLRMDEGIKFVMINQENIEENIRSVTDSIVDDNQKILIEQKTRNSGVNA